MSIIQSFASLTPEALGELVQGEFRAFMRDGIQAYLNEVLDGEIEDFLSKAMSESGERIYRNGYYSRTVQTSFGPITLSVPRDRLSLFKTEILRPYQRSTDDLEYAVQSLYLHGMTLSEISSHLAESSGAEESRETIRKAVAKLAKKADEFRARRLPECVAVYLDGTYVPLRRRYGESSSVSKECIEVALGVTKDGRRHVLAFGAVPNEGSGSWRGFLEGLKRRGVGEPKLFVTDGLRGMPEAIASVFPGSKRQACLVHAQRNISKAVRVRDREAICADFKGVYSSPSRKECDERFAEFCSKWAKPYPSLVLGLVERQESLFRFYDFPKAMRRAIYTSNAIESLNSIIKRMTRRRIQYNSGDSALITLTKVCEDYNRDARPARFILEMSEGEKAAMGFEI